MGTGVFISRELRNFIVTRLGKGGDAEEMKGEISKLRKDVRKVGRRVEKAAKAMEALLKGDEDEGDNAKREAGG